MTSDQDDSWQRFRSQDAPASFVAAWTAATLVTGLGFALYMVLLPVVFRRSRELVRKRVPRTSKSRRMVFWVLVNVAVNAAQEAFNLWSHSTSAGASASRCHAAQKVSAMLYGVATAAVYWVLVVRAEATLDRRSPRHMLVYRLCKLGVTAGVPGLMVLAAVYFEGRVLFDWACTQQLLDAVVVLFIALDLGLSVLLLLLFYIPVRQHLAAFKTKEGSLQDEAARIHKMALRALRLSLVQVVSTFAAQLFGLVTQSIFDDAQAPQLAHWRYVRYILYTVDVWVNTLCMLAMSSVWIPDRLRNLQPRASFLALSRGSQASARALQRLRKISRALSRTATARTAPETTALSRPNNAAAATFDAAGAVPVAPSC